MTLDDLLHPNEEIRYRREMGKFTVGGEKYDELIITNQRLIFYRRSGILFKKDMCETIGLSSIDGIKFKEKGRIFKKGVVEIFGSVKYRVEGTLADGHQLHQMLIEKLE